MHLHELEGVAALIHAACVAEKWRDSLSGLPLEPRQVNLYQFNHNVICPLTASPNLTLACLNEGFYHAGQLLQQLDSNGNVVAEGVIKHDVKGFDVDVKLRIGRFSDSMANSSLALDGVPCGTLKKVLDFDSVSYKELISSISTPPAWYTCHWLGGRPLKPFFIFRRVFSGV